MNYDPFSLISQLMRVITPSRLEQSRARERAKERERHSKESYKEQNRERMRIRRAK